MHVRLLKTHLSRPSDSFIKTFIHAHLIVPGIIYFRRFLIFAMIFLPLMGFQSIANPNTDSLWKIWNDTSMVDTLRLHALNSYISKGFLYTNTDSALKFTHKVLSEATIIGNEKYKADPHRTLSISYTNMGMEEYAINKFKHEIKFSQDHGMKNSEAHCLINIRSNLGQLGSYNEAIEKLHEGIEICKEIGDVEFRANALNSVALIFACRCCKCRFGNAGIYRQPQSDAR